MIEAHIRRVPGYLVRDLPPFVLAMVVAEIFFKFGSFTLECLGFLALWYVLAQLYRRIQPWRGMEARDTSAQHRPGHRWA